MRDPLYSVDEKIYNVSEISNLLRVTIENNFANIKIKAELSGVKIHTSGHMYFALKDNNAVIDGVCWRGILSKIAFQPQDGVEVICSGKLTTYPGRSKYQLVVSNMQVSGTGTLLKLLEELKQKLIAEGLFKSELKQKIPYLPQSIGVITSNTGSVIQDILHRIADRFPRKVLLWPVSVQGVNCVSEVTNAIKGFNEFQDDDPAKPEVIILARGGGSIEDLWSFNDEQVVRSIVQSNIPIISAIGHETDTTLADFAADFRAPTPTAAAEKCVPVQQELLKIMQHKSSSIDNALQRIISDKIQRHDSVAMLLKNHIMNCLRTKHHALYKLTIQSPQTLIVHKNMVLDSVILRLHGALKNYMYHYKSKLGYLVKLLAGLSYNGTLQRGFCLLKNDNGQIIKSGTQIIKDQKIMISTKDSTIFSKVEKVVPS